MMIRATIFISIIVLSILSLGSFYVTRAYLLDTETFELMSFTTAPEFNVTTPNPDDNQDPQEDPTSTPSGKILINEVSARGGDDKDWIEIYNGTSSEIDLGGWSIEDNSDEVYFPESGILLPAGGYAIVVSDSNIDEFESSVTRIIVQGSIGNGLNPTTDRAILRNVDNTVADQVSWGNNKTVFDLPSIPENNTLYRFPNGTDTDQSSDWKLGLPSLGKVNE